MKETTGKNKHFLTTVAVLSLSQSWSFFFFLFLWQCGALQHRQEIGCVFGKDTEIHKPKTCHRAVPHSVCHRSAVPQSLPAYSAVTAPVPFQQRGEPLRQVKHCGSRIAFLASTQTTGFGSDPKGSCQHRFPGFERRALSSTGAKKKTF